MARKEEAGPLIQLALGACLVREAGSPGLTSPAPEVLDVGGDHRPAVATGDLEPALAARQAVTPEIRRPVAWDVGFRASPDDAARVALFRATDLAMLMTGSTLLVDAGDVAV